MTAADNERVKRAIDKAEAGTTGKVVVRIVPEAEADALALALKRSGFSFTKH